MKKLTLKNQIKQSEKRLEDVKKLRKGRKFQTIDSFGLGLLSLNNQIAIMNEVIKIYSLLK